MFFAGLPKAVAHCKTKRGENALNLAVRAGMVFESTPKILVFFQKKKILTRNPVIALFTKFQLFELSVNWLRSSLFSISSLFEKLRKLEIFYKSKFHKLAAYL